MNYYPEDGHDYGIPDYDPLDPPRQQRMIAFGGQGRRIPQPGHGAPDRNMRFPARPQPSYATHGSSTEDLYDGSAYGEPEADQWPLPVRPSPQQQLPSSRGPPPQRPQRPDAPRQIRDPPRPSARVAPANKQYHPPPPPPIPQYSHHGSGEWTGDGYSVAGAPTFPQSGPGLSSQEAALQAQINAANRRPPLGPPPSARRGPASYYPQVAPVHPIAEETDSVRNPSTRSYASSNAIPIGVPDYYLENRESAPSMSGMSMPDYYLENRDSVPSMPERRSVSDYESDDADEAPHSDQQRRDGRDGSLGSHQEREEASPEPGALVKQASLGKRSKPTLTTVKSGDGLRKDSARGVASLPSQQGQEAADPSITTRPEVPPMPAPPYTQKDSKNALSTTPPTNGLLSSGTGLIDASSSESEKSMKKARLKELLGVPMPAAQRERMRARTPIPRAEVLKGLEGGGALSAEDAEEQLKLPAGGISELRASKRRPPRLNVDAVKEAEARGSLTSLPDLIKRATKLASNLDRGRTASRLGMDAWLAGSGEDLQKHQPGMSAADYRRSNGSLSDILASFPPPGLATPTGEKSRGLTSWPSGLRHSMVLYSDSDGASRARGQRKQCCGIPVWLFLLIIVVLLLLAAAAIIVPIFLVVVPRQHNSSGAQNAALSTCQQQLTCANGGTNVVGSDGVCRCVCVNGYTGKNCAQQSAAACTTTAVGRTNDATVGTAIPRLLQGAASNYGIPLDGETLLGLFSSANMTCQTQNALVTFNGLNERALSELEHREPTPVLQVRRATATTPDALATSNGIVYESGTPAGASASLAATLSAPSAATPSSTASSSSASTNSSTAIDFARIAVLYVFQASGQLGTATTAQGNLQSYFTSGQTLTGQAVNPASVSLGNGFTCDLQGHNLGLANGTAVGSSAGSG